MNSKIEKVFSQIYQSDEEVMEIFRLSPPQLERIKSDPKYIRPWLMKRLVDDYNVNPLYVFSNHKNIFLNT